MAVGAEKLKLLYLSATGQPERAEEVLRRVGPRSSTDTVALMIDILRCTGRVEEALAESDLALSNPALAPRLIPDYAAHIVLWAFTGRLDEARALLPRARVSTTLASAPWSRATLAIAEAAVAVAAGQEQLAAELLQPGVDMAKGRICQPLIYHSAWLPLTYVLCPSTREDWELAELGGTLETIREQVAALVGIRGSRSLDGTGDWPNQVFLRCRGSCPSRG